MNAYNDDGAVCAVVLKSNLTAGGCNALSIVKRRGRPKRKRTESQYATQNVEKQKKQRIYGSCNQLGHNKRTCNVGRSGA